MLVVTEIKNKNALKTDMQKSVITEWFEPLN